jgi:hypothetical protein
MSPTRRTEIDNLDNGLLADQSRDVPALWQELFAVTTRSSADNLTADLEVDAFHAWRVTATDEGVDPPLGDCEGGRDQRSGRRIGIVEGVDKVSPVPSHNLLSRQCALGRALADQISSSSTSATRKRTGPIETENTITAGRGRGGITSEGNVVDEYVSPTARLLIHNLNDGGLAHVLGDIPSMREQFLLIGAGGSPHSLPVNFQVDAFRAWCVAAAHEELDERPSDCEGRRDERAGGRVSVQESIDEASASESRDGLLSGKSSLGRCSPEQPPCGNPAARRKIGSAFEILERNIASCSSCC